MNEESKERIVGEEAVNTVSDGKGELRAIIRRDPVSRKHLVYFVSEATSSDIADFIKTGISSSEK